MHCATCWVAASPVSKRNLSAAMAICIEFPSPHPQPTFWTIISTLCLTNSIELPMHANVSWKQFAAIRRVAGTGIDSA